MISMNDTAKKIFRSSYMPLELKDFSKATQEQFYEFIGKGNNSRIDKLLTKQATRAALHAMLDDKRQGKHDDEENLKLIRKDFEIIDCCYDPPIESFYDDHSSQVIEFFEDYTVLISDVLMQYSPFFEDNYYSYIYNNLLYLCNVMHDEKAGKKNKLEKFGIYFKVDDGIMTVLYTEKFVNGLFTPSYFKPKRK